MKTIFLVLTVLVLLVTSAAFAQNAAFISSQPNPYRPAEHPQHASTHALAQEQYVLGGSNYSSDHGEKPMWEFQQGPQAPLGDIARTLKAEHAKLKKARIVFEN